MELCSGAAARVVQASAVNLGKRTHQAALGGIHLWFVGVNTTYMAPQAPPGFEQQPLQGFCTEKGVVSIQRNVAIHESAVLFGQ